MKYSKVILAILFVGFVYYMNNSEQTPNSYSVDGVALTCSFCRETFVETEGKGMIVWNHSNGTCLPTKKYDGFPTGYCSDKHCKLAN